MFSKGFFLKVVESRDSVVRSYHNETILIVFMTMTKKRYKNIVGNILNLLGSERINAQFFINIEKSD